jgi:hypothetical protein
MALGRLALMCAPWSRIEWWQDVATPGGRVDALVRGVPALRHWCVVCLHSDTSGCSGARLLGWPQSQRQAMCSRVHGEAMCSRVHGEAMCSRRTCCGLAYHCASWQEHLHRLLAGAGSAAAGGGRQAGG